VLLEVDHISLAFKGVKAIDDVSFTVHEEELFAVIGPNGAGKTSIFNSISQVYRPQEGDIRWKGKSLFGTRPDRVAELGIARTFQNIELFPQMTVLQNLLLVLDNLIGHESTLGLPERAAAPRRVETHSDLPSGIDRPVDVRGRLAGPVRVVLVCGGRGAVMVPGQ
jgi:ABC-type branched-subunit amino acid transport system ATPase component